eukprot:c11606_g1_i1 orf=97-390(+)
MEPSITPTGLEEILDEKLKAFATLDYKELKNQVAYYQNSTISKQLLQQRFYSRDHHPHHLPVNLPSQLCHTSAKLHSQRTLLVTRFASTRAAQRRLV